MKKTLSIIALSAMAWAGAQAQQAFTMMNFPGIMGQPKITLNNGTTAANSLSDGYIATFWWSPDDSAGSYKALGATYFSDVDPASFSGLEGGFFYMSNALLDYDEDGQGGYISVKIFQYNAVDTSKWGAGDWINFCDSLQVTDLDNAAQQKALTDLWAAAQTDSPEYYEGKGSFSTLANGFPPDGSSFMGWSEPFKLNVNPNYTPVPEPSTWLLLGAGAAFVVVMRRRKK